MQSFVLAALIIGAGALRMQGGGSMVPDLSNAPAGNLKTQTEEDLMGNWCDSSKKSCLTKFEKKYLEDHQEELKEGLAALRSWGCVKQGNKVVTGGIYRSGSTLLFNQVRLWMTLAFPDNVASGFAPSPEQFNKPGGAVVAKVHLLPENVAKWADHFLMSRRKVVDSLVTRLHLKFENGTMSDDELQMHTESQCRILMTQQRDAYKVWEKTGRSVDYDVLLADYQNNPAREIQKIAESSGVCKQAAENKALQAFVQAVGQELSDHSGNDNSITQMHRVSEEVDKAKIRPSVQQHMDKIPKCRDWAAAEADPSKNKD